MKRNLIVITGLFLVLAVTLVSFKSGAEPKKITILRQYLSTSNDYGNFIIAIYPDGKTKKQQLLQNKPANYELNEKAFVQQLNELINSGLEIKHVTSSGSAELTITTFIMQ